MLFNSGELFLAESLVSELQNESVIESQDVQEILTKNNPDAKKEDELRGLIGEYLGFESLITSSEVIGKYSYIINGLEIVKRVPNYSTINNYVSDTKSGKIINAIKSAKLREADGMLWESLGEIDFLFVDTNNKPVIASEVKAGSESAGSAKQQLKDAVDLLPDVHNDVATGNSTYRAYEKDGKTTLSKNYSNILDLSNTSQLKTLTVGAKNKPEFSLQMKYSDRVITKAANKIVSNKTLYIK